MKVEEFIQYDGKKPEKNKTTEKLIRGRTKDKRWFLHHREMEIYKKHGIRFKNKQTVCRFRQFRWLAK